MSGERRKAVRVTPVQLEMLESCAESDKHCGSARYLRSLWALKAAGLIDVHIGRWYSITEAGKSYLQKREARKDDTQ